MLAIPTPSPELFDTLKAVLLFGGLFFIISIIAHLIIAPAEAPDDIDDDTTRFYHD